MRWLSKMRMSVARDKYRVFLCVFLAVLVLLVTMKNLGVHTRMTDMLWTRQWSDFRAGSSYRGYDPDWNSLDKRPLPQWYDDAKFGIFIHWGLYSVPAFGSEWFWYSWKSNNDKAIAEFMAKNYPEQLEYKDFIPMFTAKRFNPDYWADLFQESGAKYIVLTSKHHEGWTNWGSKYSWIGNSVDSGPHRDLVGALAASIQNKPDLHFGLYYSLLEWYHPLYLEDKSSKFTTQKFVKEVVTPQLHEIINNYKPELLWLDGDWHVSKDYWNATNFLAWLYSSSPVKDTIVTNDRWGPNFRGNHGDYYTSLQQRPDALRNHKWENGFSIDKKSWGFRKNAQPQDYADVKSLLQILVSTVSCGGNLLLNIGPTSDGLIDPHFEECLRDIGSWLKINGEAIYATRPWKVQTEKDTGVWYTARQTANGDSALYAILTDIPASQTVVLESPVTSSQTTVQMLGLEKPLSWKAGEPTGLTVTTPSEKELPCQWAWVIKLTQVE
ncbi:alpha-L-fucosidase-like [Ptychodera flava]|uniref:alpha-L-fucosidase-like n=1 Tax=Ptychodera flava TaxID=63121 RepID=UPI00396A4FC0